MTKFFLIFYFMFVFVAMPVLADGSGDVVAPAESAPVVDAPAVSADPIPSDLNVVVGFIPVLMAAWKNGQWLLVGAVLSLILTFAFRKFLMPSLKLGSGVLPLVSAGLGVVAGVGAAIVGGAELMPAVLAVFSGPLASTLWDSAVKYFFRKGA